MTSRSTAVIKVKAVDGQVSWRHLMSTSMTIHRKRNSLMAASTPLSSVSTASQTIVSTLTSRFIRKMGVQRGHSNAHTAETMIHTTKMSRPSIGVCVITIHSHAPMSVVPNSLDNITLIFRDTLTTTVLWPPLTVVLSMLVVKRSYYAKTWTNTMMKT